MVEVTAKVAETAYTAAAQVGAAVTQWISLIDTPNSYSGQAGKLTKVKGTEDGLEFFDIATVFDPIYLRVDGANAMAAALNMGTNLINNVVDPVSDQDAATKKYVDDSIAPEKLWDRTGTSLIPENAGDDVGNTTTRINKGWFDDLEITNLPTVGGTSIGDLYVNVAGDTMTGDLIVSDALIKFGDADSPLTKNVLIFGASDDMGVGMVPTGLKALLFIPLNAGDGMGYLFGLDTASSSTFQVFKGLDVLFKVTNVGDVEIDGDLKPVGEMWVGGNSAYAIRLTGTSMALTSNDSLTVYGDIDDNGLPGDEIFGVYEGDDEAGSPKNLLSLTKAGGLNIFKESSTGENFRVRQYGFITADATTRCFAWRLDDTNDHYILSNDIGGIETDVIEIASDGSLGINNSDLLSRLHVREEAGTDVGIIFGDTETAANGSVLLGTGSNSGPFFSGNTNPDGTVHGGIKGSRIRPSAVGIVFETSDEITGSRIWDEVGRMEIGGNFGWGTSNPARFVDIEKNSPSGSPTALPWLRIGNLSTTTHSFSAMSLAGNNDAVIGNLLLDGLGTSFAGTAGLVVYTQSNHPLMFGANSALAMTIDTSQNVNALNNFTIGQGAIGVDYTLTFDGENNDCVITWLEDEALLKFDSSIRVGSAANYTEIDDVGDVTFVGGGGLVFGEIYAYEVSTTITIAASGIANKVQITAFNANGQSNNTTPDHVNDHITVTKAGRYLVTVSMSIESTGGTPYVLSAGIWTNNGATQFQNAHMSRQLAGGGSDVGSTSMTGICDFAANDTVELWIWNETNANNVIVDDVTLSVIQIGGT